MQLNINEVFRKILKKKGMTQKELVESAGYKSISILTTPMYRGDMMITTMFRLAEAAGYKVCLISGEGDFLFLEEEGENEGAHTSRTPKT